MHTRTLPAIAPLFALGFLVTALIGPPHIKVEQVTDARQAPTPGAVLAVTGDHHQDSNKPAVTGRAEGMQGGKRIARAITLTPTKSKNQFGVARQWDAGSPWVLVFTVEQGDHGEFGAAEALVKVDAAGKIVSIDYPKQTNARGDKYGRRATPREIDLALTSLGSR